MPSLHNWGGELNTINYKFVNKQDNKLPYGGREWKEELSISNKLISYEMQSRLIKGLPHQYRQADALWPTTLEQMLCKTINANFTITRTWANAQRDGRPAEHRWRPLFNAAKFGWRPLLDCRAVTLPRRESRWNYLGCPKLVNRAQPLVG